MKPKDRIFVCAAAVLFVLSAAVYFSPLAIPHKIAVGLLVLTVFSVGKMPWTMTLAFFFSFLGDLAGSYKAGSTGDIPFLLQMAGFAAAHVCFIIYFLRRRDTGMYGGRSSGASFGRNAVMSPWRRTVYALLAASILLCAVVIIVPCVPPGVLRLCVLCYAVIIASMLLSALLTGDPVLSAAALLFVFSDFILASGIFVTDIPYSGYLVMLPYYSAQLLFFLRSSALSHIEN